MKSLHRVPFSTNPIQRLDDDTLYGRSLSRVCLGYVYTSLVSSGRGAHRIGEFARRVGVSPELLRAWEQRYGLLQPVRSAGGFRLYTEEDADRVARMRRGLANGLSAAEAARVAREGEVPTRGLIDDAGARLLMAVEAYDEAAFQAVLDDGVAA